MSNMRNIQTENKTMENVTTEILENDLKNNDISSMEEIIELFKKFNN